MAKVVYPAVVTRAYAGGIMSARQKLTEIASYVQKRPSAATDIAGQITAALKSVFPTKAVVTHGQVINVGGHTYALTIVNGVVTAIVYT